MNYCRESEELSRKYANLFELSSIYDHHNEYVNLCLKYPNDVNMSNIVRPDTHYFNGGCNDYQKSRFVCDHINKSTNKLVLELYIIDNNYFITEEYVFKILVDHKIRHYLCNIFKVNSHFPELYIDEHTIRNLKCKQFDNSSYYHINTDGNYLNRYKSMFEVKIINHKKHDQQIIELTNSFVDMIDDLQNQICSLKAQVNDLKTNNTFHNLGISLYNKK